MFGWEGDTAIDPIDEMGCSSKTGFHVVPPSVVFQTPPEAVAAYAVDGSPGTPATRDTRPPAAGPTRRYLRALNSFGAAESSFFCSCASGAVTTNATARAVAGNVRILSMVGNSTRLQVASALRRKPHRGYSVRNAAIGSIRSARRAGT